MKDKVYIVSLNFIEEKVKKIIEMHSEIGFIACFGLLSILREQEIIYIKEKRFAVIVMVVIVIAYIKLNVEKD